jgi:hypothetical protein
MCENKIKCVGCREILNLNNFDSYYYSNREDKFFCLDCFKYDFAFCLNCRDLYTTDNMVFFDNFGLYCCNGCEEYYLRCDNCNEWVYEDDYLRCDNCNRYYCCHCGICCNCNNEEDYLTQEQHDIPFKIENSKTFKKNPFKNSCGLEIECYCNKDTIKYDELKKYSFSSVYDGSLNNSGIEFVSCAFNGDLLFNRVIEFCNLLNSRGFKVNSTCGLHIHINIKKNLEYLKKILKFYSIYEDFIFMILPKSRHNNSYCSKINKMINVNNIDDIKNFFDLEKLIYKLNNREELKQIKKEKYSNSRYCWLNLHSFFYRKTLEFRSHSGTLNPKKINSWFKIHLTILDFLKNNDYNFISNMPKNFNLFLSLFDRQTKIYIMNRILILNKELYREKIGLYSEDDLINLAFLEFNKKIEVDSYYI